MPLNNSLFHLKMSSNIIKLYSYYRSSAAYRVRIALNLKHIDYQIIAVHLTKEGGENWKKEYMDINPQGFVPALNDGITTITQSLAIIEYLEEKFPKPPLLPSSPSKRALCRGLAQIICSDIHPLDNLRVLDYLKDEFSCTQAAVDTWYCYWIHQGLHAFETQLAKRTTQSSFCCGELPGMADICLIPQLYNAKRFNCDISAFPIITQIGIICNELNTFKHAQPESQADAE